MNDAGRTTRKTSGGLTPPAEPLTPAGVPPDAIAFPNGWVALDREIPAPNDEGRRSAKFEGRMWSRSGDIETHVFIKRFEVPADGGDSIRRAWDAEHTKIKYLNANSPVVAGHAFPRMMDQWSEAVPGGENLYLVEKWEDTVSAEELAVVDGQGAPLPILRAAISEWANAYAAMAAVDRPVLHGDPSPGNYRFDLRSFQNHGEVRGLILDFETSRFVDEDRPIEYGTLDFMGTRVLAGMHGDRPTMWQPENELYGFAAVVAYTATAFVAKNVDYSDPKYGRPELGPVFMPLIADVRDGRTLDLSVSEFARLLLEAMPRPDEHLSETVTRVLADATRGVLPARMGDSALTWAIESNSPETWAAGAAFCDAASRGASTGRTDRTQRGRDSERYRTDLVILLHNLVLGNHRAVLTSSDMKFMLKRDAARIAAHAEGGKERRRIERRLVELGALSPTRNRTQWGTDRWWSTYRDAMDSDGGTARSGTVTFRAPNRSVVFMVDQGQTSSITPYGPDSGSSFEHSDVVVTLNDFELWQFLARLAAIPKEAIAHVQDGEHRDLLQAIAEARPPSIETQDFTKGSPRRPPAVMSKPLVTKPEKRPKPPREGPTKAQRSLQAANGFVSKHATKARPVVDKAARTAPLVVALVVVVCALVVCFDMTKINIFLPTRTTPGWWSEFSDRTAVVLAVMAGVTGAVMLGLLINALRLWYKFRKEDTPAGQRPSRPWFLAVAVAAVPLLFVYGTAVGASPPGSGLLPGWLQPQAQTNKVIYEIGAGSNKQTVSLHSGPTGGDDDDSIERTHLITAAESDGPMRVDVTAWTYELSNYNATLTVWVEVNLTNRGDAPVPVSAASVALLVDGNMTEMADPAQPPWDAKSEQSLWWEIAPSPLVDAAGAAEPAAAPFSVAPIELAQNASTGGEYSTADTLKFVLPVPADFSVNIIGLASLNGDRQVTGASAADRWGSVIASWRQMSSAGEVTRVWDLQGDDCFRFMPRSSRSWVAVVPCQLSHDADVVTLITYPDPLNPDASTLSDEVLQKIGSDKCAAERTRTSMSGLFPTPEDWKEHPVLVCIVPPQ